VSRELKLAAGATSPGSQQPIRAGELTANEETTLRLEGKNVLVTGASSGIGQAIAVRFAREGANVAINYRSGAEEAQITQALARKARTKTGGTELVVQADVSREDQVKAMFAKVLESFGSLDVLVNNAGIQKACPSHEIEVADFDRVIGVNLRGPFLCAREAIRHFLSRDGGGTILNNSSVHEIIPKPKYLSYSISKGGMENLTKTLALEYAGQGIRVNAVGPGAVVTPINSAWIDNPKARQEVESHIPMTRAASAEEIASVFAFLASDDASYITGQTIFACGGLTLYPEFRVAWSSGE
jgi:glucose 1-dehydrogenase